MSRRRHKPQPQPAQQDAAPDATPQPTPQPSTTPAHDPDTLTPDEEEAYSLLVDYANARREQDGHKREQPKGRVEFSQLVTRARAVRFVLSWFAGALPSVAMQETGIAWGDLMICRLASPDFNAVFDFCRTSTGERLAVKALNTTEKALDGRDVGKEAASLSKFILERLAADSYGDPRYKQGGGRVAVGGNVYQINLIQAAATPPALCGASVAEVAKNAINAEKAAIDV